MGLTLTDEEMAELDEQAKEADRKEAEDRERMRKWHNSPEGKRINAEAEQDIADEDAQNG